MNYGDTMGYLIISFYVALLLSNLAILAACQCPGRGARPCLLAVRAALVSLAVELTLLLAALRWEPRARTYI